MKKLIAGIFTLTMVFGLMTANQTFSVSAKSTSTSSAASNDTTKNIEDNWEYSIDANNNIILNRYKGKSTKVVVPSTIYGKKVVRIGTRSFAGCNINEIVIPEGITVIGDEAFLGCCGLKEVKLPKSLTTIRQGAFKTCTVETINIPGRVTSIGKEAFRNSWLKKITLSEGLINIKESAFNNCDHLTEINLPSSVQTIGDMAFYDSGLEHIKIPSGVSSIGARAFAYTPIYRVEMSKGVTEIGEEAFAYCKEICEIPMPEGLETISDRAFYRSDIRKAVIPKSVKKIGNEVYTGTRIETLIINGRPEFAPRAFADCKYLKNLTMDLEFKFDGSIFNGCTSIYTINDYLINGIGSKDIPFINGVVKKFVLNNFRSANDVGFINTYVKNQTHYVVSHIITNDMSDVEKVVAIQKWVSEQVEYNHKDIWGPTGFVDSSIFLNDLTVCNGYARGTALLLQEAGFEAYCVHNGIHAWNIVKIGNHYFHMDVTYADSFSSGINYKRFLSNDTKNYEYNNPWSLWKPSSLYNYSENTALPKCPYMLGDVDMNGTIDNSDYDYLCKYLNGKKTIKNGDKILADLDYDGDITENDAQILDENIQNNYYA